MKTEITIIGDGFSGKNLVKHLAEKWKRHGDREDRDCSFKPGHADAGIDGE